MIDKDTLLSLLPPYQNKALMLVDVQNTNDIRKAIKEQHLLCEPDYDLIAHYFDTGNVVDTSRQIFDFLKLNVPYTKESGRNQTVKNPTAILTDGEEVDCKNYSLFIAGILDSIKRQNGGNWDWTFRFASYDEQDPEPGHVFVVVKVDGKELWVDPVFTYFNQGKMHEWEIDEKPTPAIGGLYRISGPPPADNGMITVNTKDAAKNFLVAVTLDLFGLRDLLTAYPSIFYGPVKQALIQSGVNFSALVNILKHGKR